MSIKGNRLAGGQPLCQAAATWERQRRFLFVRLIHILLEMSAAVKQRPSPMQHNASHWRNAARLQATWKGDGSGCDGERSHWPEPGRQEHGHERSSKPCVG